MYLEKINVNKLWVAIFISKTIKFKVKKSLDDAKIFLYLKRVIPTTKIY